MYQASEEDPERISSKAGSAWIPKSPAGSDRWRRYTLVEGRKTAAKGVVDVWIGQLREVAVDSIDNRWMIVVGNAIGPVRVPVVLLRPGPAGNSRNSSSRDSTGR